MWRQLTATLSACSALVSPPRTAHLTARRATLKPLKSKPFVRRWLISSFVTFQHQIWKRLLTNCCLIPSLRISKSRATEFIHYTMSSFARWDCLFVILKRLRLTVNLNSSRWKCWRNHVSTCPNSWSSMEMEENRQSQQQLQLLPQKAFQLNVQKDMNHQSKLPSKIPLLNHHWWFFAFCETF